jgi:8-amino-7-oxononanoate synthase
MLVALGMPDEPFLSQKLEERRAGGALRSLQTLSGKTDLYSNDYLGLARSNILGEMIAADISSRHLPHGSTGSRLLSGNHPVFEETERIIAETHHGQAALIFNSGYDANTGLLSSVPARGEVILYDSLIHASLRDGVRLSLATAHSFPHNDMDRLEDRLRRLDRPAFVVVESVYSMDGDLAPLEIIASLCERYGARLIVDEAHATGVVGAGGEGLVQQLKLEDKCLARIHTFGKALGVHGAAVVGSNTLKQYLVNFARSFIYTTALPPSSVAAIAAAYRLFPSMHAERAHLDQLINGFRKAGLPFERTDSATPIQILVTPGNEKAKALEARLQQAGLGVRAILSPTVPKGKERLRIVLHSFNTSSELQVLLQQLRTAG